MKYIKPCPRVIRQSKFEKNDSSNKDWWGTLCKMLEEKFAIPPHRKQAIIEDIYPEKIIRKILSILSFIKDDDSVQKVQNQQDENKQYLGNIQSSSTHSINVSENLFDDKHKKTKAGCNASNPYLQFFKRREDRAAIWRPLPPLSLEEMNLTQKAEAITEAIATDFVVWLRNMGGDEEPSLDVPTVMKMFEIGFHMHAATSLFVRIKEMPSVPQQVADKRNLPETSKRACLHRQLQRDIHAARLPEKTIAFGTILPKEYRYKPPKDEVTTKWLGLGRIKKELATMSAVWHGITHLRSTRGFCNWLIEHPDIPPPHYLEETGMLDPLSRYQNMRHQSIETQESFGPTVIPPGLTIENESDDKKNIDEEQLSEGSDVDTAVTIAKKTF